MSDLLVADPTSGRGLLAVMDQTGDTKITWDSRNADEVAAARKTFDDLKAKGFTAYSVDDEGGKHEVLHKFDPSARKIIMSPRMVGG